MAGFTQDQLDEQLVLIMKLYSGELSNSDFDKSMSELKDVHQAVNDSHQLVLDARNTVDIWIGGAYQRKMYAPVRSACEDARDAVKGSMEDRKKAFNAKWKELDYEIKTGHCPQAQYVEGLRNPPGRGCTVGILGRSSYQLSGTSI